MVMKRNAMRKNLIQSILKSLGRYIAIVMIIALGAGMFVGLLMTKSDMVATGQKYMDEQNMFDLRLVSTYGWEQEQLDAISQMEGVVDAEGIRYVDAIAATGDSDEESVYRFYAIPKNVNRISLRGGRMPVRSDECLIDGYHTDDSILGTVVTILDTNDEDTLDSLTARTYTIVGYVASPLFMDMNRGTTSVGNGSLSNCFYVPDEGLDTDLYMEINITIPGDYDVYSDTYNEAMETAADELQPGVEVLGRERFEQLRQDALDSYREGRREYLDGLNQFKKAKAEALAELDNAYQMLLDAQVLIAENEAKIAEGEKQLASAKSQLAAGQKQLDEGREQYETIKSAISAVATPSIELMIRNRDELIQKIAGIDAEIADIDAELGESILPDTDHDSEKMSLDFQIAQLDGLIAATEAAIEAANYTLELLNQNPEFNALLITQTQDGIAQMTKLLEDYRTQRSELVTQRDALQEEQTDPGTDISALQQRKLQLQTERSMCQTALEGLELAISGADTALTELMNQMTSLEQQLIDGEAELARGRAQIASAERQLAEGKAQLEQAKIDLAQGLIDYEEGKKTAEQELEDAQKKLDEGKVKLDDGLITISQLKDVTVMILDRNTNVGYGSLDSASDIVQGVSRVFPAFFLLVAALV